MYRIACLVLCLVAASHQFNVTKFQVPGEVEVGGDAELVCEHDAGVGAIVKWWWVLGDETRHQLYQRLENANIGSLVIPDVDPPLNLTLKGNDSDNIMLWNLQPTHSGEYSCEVTQNLAEEHRNAGDLLVYSLGSGPLLNTTKFEGDSDVQVTCEAVGVAPKPDITITIDSNTYNTSALQNATGGLYNVFANATFREVDLEGKEVQCTLSFKNYAIEDPSAMTKISNTYHSDAWLASSTTAPETTELAPTETPEQLLPGGGARAHSSWVLLAALVIPAQMLALL